MSNLTTSIQLTANSTYKLNNGLQIPVAGYGIYLVPKHQTQEYVYTALDVGYRHIDGAVGYGNEAEAAKGIHQFLQDHPDVKREDIWFTTKIRNSEHGYEKTKAEVEGIAQRVKEWIGYVDLVLLHSPKSSPELRLASWKALQEYVQPNNTLHVKSLGVSNFGVRHLEELLNWDGLLVKPVLNQLELHPWSPKLQLREYLAKHEILAEAYSPLTQGAKTNDPELLELEHKYGVLRFEILLKWSYIQGFIVLAKTVNKDRIKLNFEILPPGQPAEDALGEETHYGKVDLDLNILEALDKPDSDEIFTWDHVDPTKYEP